MKIRRGKYCIYKGKEILFFKSKEQQYVISANNIEETDGSFFEYEIKGIDTSDIVYRKIVTPEEIGETYRVFPYAIYKGHPFWVYGMYEDKVILGEGSVNGDYDESIRKKFNMVMVDRGVYELEVPLSETTIVERVKYFDKYKFFAGGGFQYYKEEDIVVENPEW